MLVLSRKIDEQIQIGPNITITLVQIRGGSVRIGIEAPRDVRVLRSELPPLPEESLQNEAPASERVPAIAQRPRAVRPVRLRRHGQYNPGERAVGPSQPLAAKLQARRARGRGQRRSAS